jgi:hypothetical protein
MSPSGMQSTAPRSIATALMGLTAGFTLLGGAGTSCVALAAGRWDSMAALVPYMWLYQILVVLTIADAVVGLWATVGLARRRRNAYTVALIALVAGILLAGIQMATSLRLRGGAAPTNMRLYFTVFTLLVFLVLRLPPIWKRNGFDSSTASDSGNSTAGLAAFLMGALVLTTSFWAGPSHTFEGRNWVLVWDIPLMLIGSALIVGGLVLLVLALTPRSAGRAMESGADLSHVA